MISEANGSSVNGFAGDRDPDRVDTADRDRIYARTHARMRRIDFIDQIRDKIGHYEELVRRYEDDPKRRAIEYYAVECEVKALCENLAIDDRNWALAELFRIDPKLPIDRSLAWMRTGRGEKVSTDVGSLPGGTLGDLEDLLGDLETEWVVPNAIPMAGLTILSGDPKAGKSLVSYALAVARVMGGYFGFNQIEPGPVIHLQTEEGFPTVRRRYRAAGGPGFDVRNPLLDIINLWDKRNPESVKAREFDLTEPDHIARLRKRINDVTHLHDAPPLVILDSLSRLTLAAGAADGDALGRVAYSLADVALETDAAIVVVAHNRKPIAKQERRGSADVLGSVRQTAAAESICQVMVDPDDSRRRIFQVADLRDGEPLKARSFVIDGPAVAWVAVEDDPFPKVQRRTRPTDLDDAKAEFSRCPGAALSAADLVGRLYPDIQGKDRARARAKMRKALVFGVEEGELTSEKSSRGSVFRLIVENSGETTELPY